MAEQMKVVTGPDPAELTATNVKKFLEERCRILGVYIEKMGFREEVKDI